MPVSLPAVSRLLLVAIMGALLSACAPAAPAPTVAPAATAAAKPTTAPAPANPASPAAATPVAAPAASPAASPVAVASPGSARVPLAFSGTASGTITVYSAGPAGLANNLKRDFEAATGAKVEVFQGNTGAVLARLDAEKSRPQADVVILADWSAAMDMAQKGDLMEYRPAGSNRIAARFKDPNGFFTAQGVSALGLVYNTSVPAPKEWADLAGPSFKDKITMPDPAQSGSAYDLLAGLLQNLGDDKGWDLFKQLRANGIEVPGTNDAALLPLVTGAKTGVVAGVDYLAYARIVNKEPIGIVYPASGTVVSPRPMSILKAAPNAAGAKAFTDFVLSDAGQKLVADTFLLPAREDYPVNSARAGLAEIKALPVDYTKSIAQREAILSRFAAEVAR